MIDFYCCESSYFRQPLFCCSGFEKSKIMLDLNCTLLNRDYLRDYTSNTNVLEQQIGILNTEWQTETTRDDQSVSNRSFQTETYEFNQAETTGEAYENLKIFLLKLKDEFQSVFPVLSVFLRGISQILAWLGVIGPHLQSEWKECLHNH